MEKMSTQKSADELADLASGDHNHCSKCLKKRTKSKCFSSLQTDGYLNCAKKAVSGQDMTEKLETIVKYKNDEFCDSESYVSHDEINEVIENELEINGKCVQRPVICPVSTCNKILARNSILQHFYFDHSKVPRITLNDSEPYKMFLKASSITENIRCYAVFLLKNSASLPHTTEALMNGGYKNSSVLLMGIRMPCVSTETVKKLHGSESISIRDVQTQTDIVGSHSSKTQLNTIISYKESEQDTSQKDVFSDGENIMLWLSGLGDINHYYKISVSRSDKKFGFSFTGRAINIEESHNPQVIYDRLECLLIKGRVINKLMSEQAQLQICINIV